MTNKPLTLEDIRNLMEVKFRTLTDGLARMLRSSEIAAENARLAADRALELAPRVERLEVRQDDLEIRVKALEAGGVFIETEEDP